MSERTGIEWTDSTWNPWRGCQKVSAGCAHCYMYREQTRYGRDPRAIVRAAPATFGAPLRWRGPRRVFTCSWSDFFIEEADPWRPEAWEIIRRTPSLTYLVLTKRPERIRSSLPPDWGEGYPNVWLGVSAEYLSLLAERKPLLFSVPAARRFLSAEPWLQANPWLGSSPIEQDLEVYVRAIFGFDWVIVGGESGPQARPMSLGSVRFVKAACEALSIPFFLKQLGGWPDPRSHEQALLDGRTWKGLPEFEQRKGGFGATLEPEPA
jgi:protein gp37